MAIGGIAGAGVGALSAIKKVFVLGPLLRHGRDKTLQYRRRIYLMATAACLLALLATVRSVISASPPHLKRPFDILAPQAARLAHDPLDSSGTTSR
jgi:hypothetical protein